MLRLSTIIFCSFDKQISRVVYLLFLRHHQLSVLKATNKATYLPVASHNLASQTSFPTSSALLANYYSVTKRSLSAPTQASAPDIRLYQYHICPFCNITKSLLAYAKLDYDKVEVNPLTNLHIILKKR